MEILITICKKYPADRITTSSEKDVNCWMQSQTINTTEMTVIRPNNLKIREKKNMEYLTNSSNQIPFYLISDTNLVLFQVPALNLFVISRREHICVFAANSKACKKIQYHNTNIFGFYFILRSCISFFCFSLLFFFFSFSKMFGEEMNLLNLRSYCHLRSDYQTKKPNKRRKTQTSYLFDVTCQCELQPTRCQIPYL